MPSRASQAARTTPEQVPIAQLQCYAWGSTVRTCCWSPGLATGLWRPQAFNILEKLPAAHFLSLRFVLCGVGSDPQCSQLLRGPHKVTGGTDAASRGYQSTVRAHISARATCLDESLLQACDSTPMPCLLFLPPPSSLCEVGQPDHLTSQRSFYLQGTCPHP